MLVHVSSVLITMLKLNIYGSFLKPEKSDLTQRMLLP